MLPPILVARSGAAPRGRWLATTLSLLNDELEAEGDAHVSGLVDALFAHALIESATVASGKSGLLAAARDEQIGRALAFVHEDPGRDWSIDQLASSVGLSRSRFFDRFTQLVGEPPAKYIGRWRVHTAGDLMRSRTLSTSEIAQRVGYASEDALAKAFRRYVGMTPTQWRRRNVDAVGRS